MGHLSKEIPWEHMFSSEYAWRYFYLSSSEKNREIINILPDDLIEELQLDKLDDTSFDELFQDNTLVSNDEKGILEKWKETIREINRATKLGGRLFTDEKFREKAFSIIHAEMQTFGFALLAQDTVPLSSKKDLLEEMRLGRRPNYALLMYGEIMAARLAQGSGLIKGGIFSEMLERYGLLESIAFIRELQVDPQLPKWGETFYPVLLGIVSK